MESDEELNSPSATPLEAMQVVSAARAEMIHRVKAPIWYHAAIGLLLGGVVAAQALPMAIRPLATLSILGATVVLTRAYWRSTGIRIDNFRSGRTRAVTISLAVVIYAIFLVCLYLGYSENDITVFLIGGCLTAVLGTVAGKLWERAYAKDMADPK